MNTDISHLRPNRQRELEHIVATVLKSVEDDMRHRVPHNKVARVERIILYGSYARGDWKEDHLSGFSSDFDILVVVSHAKLAKIDARWIHKATDEFLRLDAIKRSGRKPQPIVSMIVHSIGDINEKLRLGRYFFADIVKEGVALYEAHGAKKFARPGQLPPEVVLEEAQKYYKEWSEISQDFVDMHIDTMKRGRLKITAFNLHQATEHLYQCILLSLTLYTPASHNIEHLRSLCEDRDPRLIDVWPRTTKAERNYFNKLKEAYVKSQYSIHWTIDAERLEWISDKVQKLQEVAKVICEERLAALKERVKR